MKTAMESIKGMVDVNIVVGDPVESPDGTVIIPVSRVSFGFAAGGGDYSFPEKSEKAGAHFGGGSGAGISVKPIGFLVCGKGADVRFLPVNSKNPADRVIEMLPKFMDKIGEFLEKKAGGPKAQTETEDE
jgi:sporulation protein YtfJ